MFKLQRISYSIKTVDLVLDRHFHRVAVVTHHLIFIKVLTEEHIPDLDLAVTPDQITKKPILIGCNHCENAFILNCHGSNRFMYVLNSGK